MDVEADNIRIIFIIPAGCINENETTEEMQLAFENCKQNNINTQWVFESNYKELKLSKTDFVVFQDFKGDCFQNIQQTKSVRVIGPWCLLTCLMEGIQIPNLSWPIYSIAMKDCIVTSSSVSKLKKKEIQEKVEYMSGFYTPNLAVNCTHLITDSVISEKYIKAAEANVKIVLPSWIDDVWNSNLKSKIYCNDPSFETHKCPVFHNLVVCCTGLNQVQRNELNKMVTENGGKYSEVLHVKNTDILVCESLSTSEKYKAAKKHPKVKCVTLVWIKDSIKNKYAMPVESYPVGNLTSTPTRSGQNIQPNFSMISNISTITGMQHIEISQIDSSCIPKLNNTIFKETTGVKRKSASNEHNVLVDSINLKEVKTIGPFLDGCSIYLIGFGSEQREKLCKILNYSGATRYDQFSERVTHVIIGDTSSYEMKLLSSKNVLKNCYCINIHWLLRCIQDKSPADEENYFVNIEEINTELNSPLSKKGLQLLRKDSGESSNSASVNVTTMNKPNISVPEVEHDIVQQYLAPNVSSQDDTLAKILRENQFNSKQDSTLTVKDLSKPPQLSLQSEKDDSKLDAESADMSSAVDDSSLQKPIFEGLKFSLEGFFETYDQIKELIENMNGKVVSRSYKGVPDYNVVPLFTSQLKYKAIEVVNELWIFECHAENELAPIKYFHHPFVVQEDVKPLKNCVVTLTTYTDYERTFLRELIIKLGGSFQEQLSKVEKNSIKATTHLVSPEASGKKYAAAVKWGLPIVTKDWLLECGRIAEKPPVEDFSINNPEGASTSMSVCKPFGRQSATLLGNTTNKKSINSTSNNTLNDNNQVGTPANRILKDVQNTSAVCSQITPVQSIIAEARKQNLLGTPEVLPRPQSWDHVDTPESPLGAFIRPNPSPHLRKEMVRFLDTLPTFKQRRDSTPLSELKRRFFDRICPPDEKKKPERLNFDSDEGKSDVCTPSKSSENKVATPENVLNNQLQQLQDMLTSSNGSCRGSKSKRQSVVPVAASEVRDSQPNTVGWDDFMDCNVEQPQKVPVFMLSALDREKREAVVTQLENFGAAVSNLSSFDPLATHLICEKPPRNEKVYACMAAGKWILHVSYVDECITNGKLANEENFEFGNPKFMENSSVHVDRENESRYSAMYYWRKEVARRGYGAFHDTRAIIMGQKRETLARIIEAGGGVVVDAKPPFNKSLHATVCLLDMKNVGNISDYIPLAKQGIYCVNATYISELLQRTASDIRNHVIPELSSYYENS